MSIDDEWYLSGHDQRRDRGIGRDGARTMWSSMNAASSVGKHLSGLKRVGKWAGQQTLDQTGLSKVAQLFSSGEETRKASELESVRG